MIPLSKKSDAQISDLLTDYGIKHGPVVNSTRGLYERKLEEAMANDRTFYREEEEEITFIVCRQPKRKKASADPSAQLLPGSEQNGGQPPDRAEAIPSSRFDQSSGADPKPEQPLTRASVKVSHTTTDFSRLEVKGPIGRQAAGKTRVVVPAVVVPAVVVPAVLALTALAAGCYYTLLTVM